MFGDNTGSVSLARNRVFHERSKHIDIHYNVVREYVKNEEFTLEYRLTVENVADLFTKGLDKGKHILFSHTVLCGS